MSETQDLTEYYEALKHFNRGQYCDVNRIGDNAVAITFNKVPKASLINALMRKFLTTLQNEKRSVNVKIRLCKGKDCMSRYLYSIPYEELPIFDDIVEDIFTWETDTIKIEFN